MLTNLQSAVLVALVSLSMSTTVQAQRRPGRGGSTLPKVGTKLPDLTVYSPDGKELKTSSLRGEYTVLTFGCLT